MAVRAIKTCITIMCMNPKSICTTERFSENMSQMKMLNSICRIATIVEEMFFRCSFNLLLLRWHFYVGIVSMKTGVQYKIRGERAPFAGYTVFFHLSLSFCFCFHLLSLAQSSPVVTYYEIYECVVSRL